MKFPRFVFALILILTIFKIEANTSGPQLSKDLQSRLHRIDSIVETVNTYHVLKEFTEFYSVYKKIDSTSNRFKRISAKYLFVLEKSELNSEAIKLANSLLTQYKDDDDFTASIYIILARLQEKVGNKELCNKRLNNARILLDNIKNDSLLLMWQIRKASYYRIFENLDSAKFFAKNAYKLAEKINQPENKAVASFLMAFLTDSISYQIELLTYSKNQFAKQKDVSGTAGMCLNLRNCYLKIGDTLRANRMLDTVRSFIVDSDFLGTKIWYYENVVSKYKMEKMYDSALVYTDSVSSLKEKLAAKQDRYLLLYKDLNLNNERLKNELIFEKQLVLSETKQNTLLYALLATILALLILITALFFEQSKKKARLDAVRIELNERNSRLNQTIYNNEVLSQELNHRVRNNLSMLSGLLELQALKSINSEVKKELKESVSRINTVATIQRKLSDTHNLENVKSHLILEELIEAQVSLSAIKSENIKYTIQPFSLNTSDFINFSLIVNELITNSIKHGKGDGEQRLAIEFYAQDDNYYLTIVDGGNGFNVNYNYNKSNTFGLYIINILVKQLNGEFSWYKNADDFVSSIVFPK